MDNTPKRQKSGEYDHTRRAPGNPNARSDGSSPTKARANSSSSGTPVDPFWDTRGPLPADPSWAQQPPSVFRKKASEFMADNPEFSDGFKWADGDFTAWEWDNKV